MGTVEFEVYFGNLAKSILWITHMDTELSENLYIRNLENLHKQVGMEAPEVSRETVSDKITPRDQGDQ